MHAELSAPADGYDSGGSEILMTRCVYPICKCLGDIGNEQRRTGCDAGQGPRHLSVRSIVVDARLPALREPTGPIAIVDPSAPLVVAVFARGAVAPELERSPA